jgi:hypothetical protein
MAMALSASPGPLQPGKPNASVTTCWVEEGFFVVWHLAVERIATKEDIAIEERLENAQRIVRTQEKPVAGTTSTDPDATRRFIFRSTRPRRRLAEAATTFLIFIYL